MYQVKTRPVGQYGKFLRVIAFFGALSGLSACAGAPESAGSERIRNPEALDLQRLLVLKVPPLIAAEDQAGISDARRLMSRLDPAELRDREGARFADANALPWLSGSAAGRAYLAATPQRVLVRGRPAEQCPVAFAEIDAPTRPVADLVASGLKKCLENAPPGCGCQVVAAGSVLLVPRNEISYATGIAARIRVQALKLDGFLVAEETPDGDVLLRDLARPVAKVTREGRDVTVTLAQSGGVYRGQARPVGYRRGRIAERIYATSESGERLSLLIGFDPDELAQFAGAWLAWPSDAS